MNKEGFRRLRILAIAINFGDKFIKKSSNLTMCEYSNPYSQGTFAPYRVIGPASLMAWFLQYSSMSFVFQVSRHAKVSIWMETADPFREPSTHSINAPLAWLRVTRGPFIYSVFRAVNPSSVFLTPVWPSTRSNPLMVSFHQTLVSLRRVSTFHEHVSILKSSRTIVTFQLLQ